MGYAEMIGSNSGDKRLKLSRPILFVTSSFPPGSGGSETVNANLTDKFEPGSIVLALLNPAGEKAGSPPTEHAFHYITSTRVSFSRRVDLYWRLLQVPVAVRNCIELVHNHNCALVVGVYPDMFAITIAQRTAEATGLPFIAYLHDTIAEGMHNQILASFARRVQSGVFEKARKMFVMSQGMADLYKGKYAIETIPLLHSYPESIPEFPTPAPSSLSALWSGNIYSVNDKAFLRVYEAIQEVGGMRFSVLSNQSLTDLQRFWIPGTNIVPEYFPITERENYLSYLRSHTVNILALNWPDEARVHKDELSSAFSTKTPEYLASGRPILLHCPADYFLARFFREHDCGEVVTDRSVDKITAAIKRLIADRDHCYRLCKNGLKAAQMFKRDRVASLFRDELELVLREKVLF